MEKITDLSFLEMLLPLLVVVFIIGTGVVWLNLHFQKNLFRQKLKENSLKSRHQQELLRTNFDVQEQERKRIAQDLHDELGAVLSILRMNLVLLEQQQANGPEGLRTGLGHARQLAEKAMTGVRGISHQLMPPQLESFGLAETLESVAEHIGHTRQMQLEVVIPSPLGELPWSINITLYRVVMELINNTLRHAGASCIEISLTRLAKSIECRYTDDGRGLPPVPNGRGLGHKGMEGRVNALGGTLDMGNQAAGGFYANIQIPLDHDE
jgi:signal transduction histidine kinase